MIKMISGTKSKKFLILSFIIDSNGRTFENCHSTTEPIKVNDVDCYYKNSSVFRLPDMLLIVAL